MTPISLSYVLINLAPLCCHLIDLVNHNRLLLRSGRLLSVPSGKQKQTLLTCKVSALKLKA